MQQQPATRRTSTTKVRVTQHALEMQSFRIFATIQLCTPSDLTTLSYSVSAFNTKARGRWGGHVASSLTGRKMRDLRSRDAKRIAQLFFTFVAK